MQSPAEVQRLRQVYHRYRESGAAQARWSLANPGNRAIVGERQRVLEQLLRVAHLLPLTGRHILDVGCGFGSVLASFTRWGASPDHLHGVDLLPGRVEEARRSFPELQFYCGNAEQLAFPDGSFDLVLLFTVFSSIRDHQMAQNAAREVRRVLRPGATIVWYDFRYNNPRNPNVRGMSCAAIRSLFPDFELRLRAVTLLPPLARQLGQTTPVLYPALARFPLLRTHYLGLLSKPAERSLPLKRGPVNGDPA